MAKLRVDVGRDPCHVEMHGPSGWGVRCDGALYEDSRACGGRVLVVEVRALDEKGKPSTPLGRVVVGGSVAGPRWEPQAFTVPLESYRYGQGQGG
jgi:hypothetical protein